MATAPELAARGRTRRGSGGGSVSLHGAGGLVELPVLMWKMYHLPLIWIACGLWAWCCTAVDRFV